MCRSCGRPKSSEGCLLLSTHSPPKMDAIEEARLRGAQLSPARDIHVITHRAVCLNCEMVPVQGPIGSWNEVVRITAIDFYSGERLLDELVRPAGRVVDWGSTMTGVSADTMSRAIEERDCFNGWQQARDALWSIVDEDTFLVGHSLQFDLEALGIIHLRVVDCSILAAKAIDGDHPPVLDLEKLCEDLLDLDLQEVFERSHNSSEVTRAVRELAISMLQDPARLAGWGEQMCAKTRGSHKRKRLHRIQDKPGRKATRLCKDLDIREPETRETPGTRKGSGKYGDVNAYVF